MSVEQPTSRQVGLTLDGYLRTADASCDGRVRNIMDTVVEERFADEVAAWSRSNDGRLRTRLAIRLEVADEFVTLCEALGPWAFVRAEEIFPLRPFPDFGEFDFDRFD